MLSDRQLLVVRGARHRPVDVREGATTRLVWLPDLGGRVGNVLLGHRGLLFSRHAVCTNSASRLTHRMLMSSAPTSCRPRGGSHTTAHESCSSTRDVDTLPQSSPQLSPESAT